MRVFLVPILIAAVLGGSVPMPCCCAGTSDTRRAAPSAQGESNRATQGCCHKHQSPPAEVPARNPGPKKCACHADLAPVDASSRVAVPTPQTESVVDPLLTGSLAVLPPATIRPVRPHAADADPSIDGEPALVIALQRFLL